MPAPPPPPTPVPCDVSEGGYTSPLRPPLCRRGAALRNGVLALRSGARRPYAALRIIAQRGFRGTYVPLDEILHDPRINSVPRLTFADAGNGVRVRPIGGEQDHFAFFHLEFKVLGGEVEYAAVVVVV